MATLYEANGTEIGRVSVDGTFPGTSSNSGAAIDVDNPDKYVLRFQGDGSRLKEGDYRVDFDSGRTVHLRISRFSRVGGVWLLTGDVKKAGAEK